MAEDSENAGDTPRGIGGVKVPSDGVERRERVRNGCGANGADMGDALRQTGGKGEGGPGLGLAFSASGTMIFGGGADPSEVITTAGEEGGVGNMSPDEWKRVEGVKRTPYARDVADAEAGGCSSGRASDQGCASGLCGRGIWDVTSQGSA
jgi:hypothetical protein